MTSPAGSGVLPAYSIRSPRLLLRAYSPSDVEPRMEAVNSSGSHLDGFFPLGSNGQKPGLDEHLAQLRTFRGRFDLDQDRLFAVLDRETGRFLGEGCLLLRAGIAAREIGYWIRKDATGQGYVTEMAGVLTRIAFEHDRASRVDIMVSPDNAPSANVARRLGFTLEGRLRDRQLAPHHPRGDLLSFTLLAGEYPRSAAYRIDYQAFDLLGRLIQTSQVTR